MARPSAGIFSSACLEAASRAEISEAADAAISAMSTLGGTVSGSGASTAEAAALTEAFLLAFFEAAFFRGAFLRAAATSTGAAVSTAVEALDPSPNHSRTVTESPTDMADM